MKATRLLALLWVPALLAAGCNRYEGTEPSGKVTPAQTTEHEIAGTGSPNDLNPVQAQMMIDDVTIGHQLAPDGTIAARQQGDDFAPGQPVYLTMKVADAPARSQVKVAWYGPGDKKIDDQQKTVEPGKRYLSFEEKTGSWPQGNYRAEVWIGDEKVNQQHFNIVESGRSTSGTVHSPTQKSAAPPPPGGPLPS
ncbi:MAG TPA: hypothetical protein VF173_33060 [Thermoanaerobaculia bacterium]|nr:hypothetical protein [Thermoanaerobaculia bacterium]